MDADYYESEPLQITYSRGRTRRQTRSRGQPDTITEDSVVSLRTCIMHGAIYPHDTHDTHDTYDITTLTTLTVCKTVNVQFSFNINNGVPSNSHKELQGSMSLTFMD